MLVKLHVSEVQLNVKAAVGGWFGTATVTVLDVLPVTPWLSVTLRVTVYVPPAAYACDGFWEVAVAPSPKVQLYAAIEPSGSLLVLVKLHVKAVQLDVKAAVGGWFGAATATDLEVLPVAPWLSVTLRVTV